MIKATVILLFLACVCAIIAFGGSVQGVIEAFAKVFFFIFAALFTTVVLFNGHIFRK